VVDSQASDSATRMGDYRRTDISMFLEFNTVRLRTAAKLLFKFSDSSAVADLSSFSSNSEQFLIYLDNVEDDMWRFT